MKVGVQRRHPGACQNWERTQLRTDPSGPVCAFGPAAGVGTHATPPLSKDTLVLQHCFSQLSPLVLGARSAPGKCHLPKQPGKKNVRLAVGFWVLGSLCFEARSSARDL